MTPEELAKVNAKIAYFAANLKSWDGDTSTHGAAMRVELCKKLENLHYMIELSKEV